MSDQVDAGATSEATRTLKTIHTIPSLIYFNKAGYKDDYDGQIIFGEPQGLKVSWGKTQKKLTQETFPHRGSNPGPLRDRRARYRLLQYNIFNNIKYFLRWVYIIRSDKER